MWQFNYGEWTESYVFLRLLSEGRINAADRNFEKIENVYMEVTSVTRHESGAHVLKFVRDTANRTVQASDNDALFRIIAYAELIEKADFLRDAMRNVTSGERKFPVPEIEEYLTQLRFSQPKIPKLPRSIEDEYGKKTDIILTVQDSIDHEESTVGFSIKSHLGGDSSLFNSAPASNFVYEIVGCDENEMYNINGNCLDSEVGTFSYIRDNPNLRLEFKGTSEAFRDNLSFIELTMPDILSFVVLTQIGYYDRANSHKTKDITDKLAQVNPVGAPRPEAWYKAKMKELLYASFSGLTATAPYDGSRKLSGGYIDVKSDGEMLYFRAVSDDAFNTFLYENTYFDRPGRGVNKNIAMVVAKAYLEGREVTEEEMWHATHKSNGKPRDKKGDWGYVYKGDDDKYYISINFQIRFK